MDCRDEILANFQAITGVNDLGECLSVLEACDWNLQEAVSMSLSMNGDDDHGPTHVNFPTITQSSSPPPLVTSFSEEVTEPIREEPSSGYPNISTGTMWTPIPGDMMESEDDLATSRQLTFFVEYNNFMYCISLPESSTVLDVKQQLVEVLGEGRVAEGIQFVQGPLLDQPDYVVLSQLHLPTENTLLIDYEEPTSRLPRRTSATDKVPSGHSGASSSSSSKRLSSGKRKTHGHEHSPSTSKVHHGSNSGAGALCQVQFIVRTASSTTNFTTSLPIHTSLQALRQLVYSRTHLHTSQQHWPVLRNLSQQKPSTSNSSHSADVSLKELRNASGVASNDTLVLHVCHSSLADKDTDPTLKVNTELPPRPTSPMTVDSDTEEGNHSSADDNDDDEDFDDLTLEPDDRDVFRRQKLIDPNEENVELCLEQFARVFSDRYCDTKSTGTASTSTEAAATTYHCMPNLAMVSLHDTTNNVLMTPTAQRKPLLLYLHRDDCITSHLFPSTVLCQPKMCQWLRDRELVIWPWDLTHVHNRARFFNWITHLWDARILQRLKSLEPPSYPLLVMVTRVQNTVKVALVVEGHELVVDDVLSRLMVAWEEYQEGILAVLAEERAMHEREMLRYEQDKAYQDSLRADQLMEEERKRRAAEEEAERRREQEMAEKVAHNRQQRMASALLDVPEEPGNNSLAKTDMAVLRFRLPALDVDGGVAARVVTRRFRADNTLRQLIAYLESLGYFKEQFKILTTFPRRDLSAEASVDVTMRELNLVPQETIILEAV